MIVDFVHRTSKPETPVKGCFYWVQNSTGSQIWFAPSDDPSELILLNDVGFLTEKDIEDIRKGVEDVRKEDDFIMGEAIDLGVSDSIDNYKDVPFTEDSYKEFYESIGVEIHKSREVDEI